jgi:hypothetical protein
MGAFAIPIFMLHQNFAHNRSSFGRADENFVPRGHAAGQQANTLAQKIAPHRYFSYFFFFRNKVKYRIY